jgi:beta-N-acetylhexosaminidase
MNTSPAIAASSNSRNLRDAYAVLLPALGSADFTEESKFFFENGGVASLLGCSREEYVARRMNSARRETETARVFASYAEQARAISPANLIAIDYEIGGVHRLHNLAPQIAHPSAALEMTTAQLEAFGRAAGLAAKKLGINFFLAPVVDVVTGDNPWLLNRTLQTDPTRVGRIASAFITGVESQGVATTAKHFPGHHHVPLDPFDSESVVVEGTIDETRQGLEPFRQVIAAGVTAIMTGPIPVPALDRVEPASTSRVVVDLLRQELKFGGLIVSDDLDLPGTMRRRSLNQVAVQSLLAGVQLLLLAGGRQVQEVAQHIAQAVENGELPQPILISAAEKVREVASQVSKTL